MMQQRRSVTYAGPGRIARAWAAAALAAAVGLSTAACGTGTPEPSQDGGTLTVGLIMKSEGSLSPYNQADGQTPLDLIYDGLVQPVKGKNGGMEFVPWLATDWEFIEGYQAISMNLRDDVTFSDGEPFNAEAVKANFQTSLQFPGTYAPLMGDATVEVTGEHSIIIRWSNRLGTSTVLEYLAAGGISANMISPKALEDPESIVSNPIGTGAYVYDAASSSQGAEIVLLPREDFWNPDVYQWDRVVVKQFEDRIAVLNALKGGQIQFGPVDAPNAAEVEASGFDLNIGEGSFTGLYFADREGALVPALGDVRVRQAINMVFDRDAIVEAVEYGQGAPGNQPHPFRDPSNDGRYAYDLEGARQLIAEAGYADGFDLTLPSYDSPYEPVLQQSLSEIGIRVKYEGAQPNEYFATAASGVWPVLLNVGPVGPFSFQYTEQFYLAPGGFYNIFAESDPEFVALLDRYKFSDPEESQAASAEISKYVLDEAWFAVMTYPYVLWAYEPAIAVESSYGPNLPPSILHMRPAG